MVLAAHSHTRYLNKEKVRSWAGDHLYWSVMRRWLFSPTPNNSVIAIQNIEEIIKTTCHQCLMQSWAPCTPRMQSSQRMNHSGGDGEGHTQPVTSFQVDNPTSEGIINKQSLQSVYQYQYQSHEDAYTSTGCEHWDLWDQSISQMHNSDFTGILVPPTGLFVIKATGMLCF